MINIYTKTQAEIDFEKAQHRYGAALVHGVPTPVCTTYLITTHGDRIDTKDLNEERILELIEADVKDYTNPHGSYRITGKRSLDAFKLIEALRTSWVPSCDALLTIAKMEAKYGHIMLDIMGSIDANNLRDKARTIASFQKQSNGDFTPVTSEEIIAVIEQMSTNEKAKRRSHKTI